MESEIISHLVDHFDGTLEYSVENVANLWGNCSVEALDDRSECVEHLGLTSIRVVVLVVEEDRFEQRRDDILCDLKQLMKTHM